MKRVKFSSEQKEVDIRNFDGIITPLSLLRRQLPSRGALRRRRAQPKTIGFG